jgi:predicted dehydrogenase
MTINGIAQVGLGNFGKRHLEAWHRLGFGEQLWIAEPDERKWAETARWRFPRARLVRQMSDVLDQVDVVDIVTPTDSHAELMCAALSAGKDVFVEKPMTANASQARQIAELAERLRRVVQVGYYYRHHPISIRLKEEIGCGSFGAVRYVSGQFMGFKRARTDVGVMHTDGIHFLDLANWLLDRAPSEVYAVCRDHFKRGLEDFAIALLTYSGGAVGKIEAGYIQPGRWKDKVVAGAMTTKEFTVVGERVTAEADFETETLTLHDVRQEFRNGTWAPVLGGSRQISLEPCDPVQMVCRELEGFLRCVETRETPAAGPVASGVNLALLMEAIYDSSRRGQAVGLDVMMGDSFDEGHLRARSRE